MGELLETLVFEVASYRSLPDEHVWRHPVRWLFDQYERVQKAKWRAWIEHILAVELGVVRGVSVALSGKDKPAKLPPLPTWEEARAARKRAEAERGPARPAWHDKFEEANRGRGILGRTGDDETSQ